MKTAGKILGIAAIMFLALSCDKDRQTGTMTVKMKDAPIAFEAVNVEVIKVQVSYENSGDANAPSGWVDLQTKAGVYNLLELQNGITAVLVDEETLPVGHAAQMRLILGSNNTVVVDGEVFNLEMSSQMNTGIKFNLNAQIKNKGRTEVLIDFDANQSIIVTGNGSFLLKPVIKVEGLVYY